MAEHAESQRPFAVILTCSDSRMCPEYLFDCGTGDIFVIRTAGNVIDHTGIGSIEYAVEFLGVGLVVILGHTNCGAVISAIDGVPLPGCMDQIISKIRPSVTSVKATNPRLEGAELADEVSRVHAANCKTDLINNSALVRKGIEEASLIVVSAVCNIKNGQIEWIDAVSIENTTILTLP